MKKVFNLSILLLLLSGFTYGQDKIKNYYNIPEVLTFDGMNYKLIASYHPTEVYYKQEYIPAEESPDHYSKMIVIDFVITDAPAKNMLQMKAKEMEDRKKSDPVVHYEVMENNDLGEYMLDFILSDGKNDKVDVVERNVYRYKGYTDKSGHKGILLFGISQRGYGNDITRFFTDLKKDRTGDINKVGSYTIPAIDIK